MGKQKNSANKYAKKKKEFYRENIRKEFILKEKAEILHEEPKEKGFKLDNWLKNNTIYKQRTAELTISFNKKDYCFVVNKFGVGPNFIEDSNAYGRDINEALSKAFDTHLNFDIKNLEKYLKSKTRYVRIEYQNKLYDKSEFVTSLYQDDVMEARKSSTSSQNSAKEALQKLNDNIIIETETLKSREILLK